jgi:hypothetical protein
MASTDAAMLHDDLLTMNAIRQFALAVRMTPAEFVEAYMRWARREPELTEEYLVGAHRTGKLEEFVRICNGKG